MCQSKAQGGLRCYNDECPVYRNAIKKGNTERVIVGGRSLLLTNDGIEALQKESDNMITEQKDQIISASNNIAVLENLQANLNEIEATRKNGVMNEDELAILQAKLAESEQKRAEALNNYNSEDATRALQATLADNEARRENTPASPVSLLQAKLAEVKAEKNSEAEYRRNPSNLYDRCGDPNEHPYILKEPNVPVDYIYTIALTTNDKKVREDAVKRYATEQGITVDQANQSLPKSYELLVNA